MSQQTAVVAFIHYKGLDGKMYLFRFGWNTLLYSGKRFAQQLCYTCIILHPGKKYENKSEQTSAENVE